MMQRRRSIVLRGAVVPMLVLGARVTAAGHQPIEHAPFGRSADQPVDLYTLTNAHGIEVRIMTYGAAIVSLKTPDRTGHLANIVLGFDSLDPYLAACRISARRSAATRIGSPTVGSCSTGNPISWPGTTGPTACTAARVASTSAFGRRWRRRRSAHRSCG